MGLEAPEHCKGYFRPILTHSSPKKLETLTFSIWENQNILVKFSLSQHKVESLHWSNVLQWEIPYKESW